MAGGKTIPMEAIQSVQFRKGGAFVNGFIQFGVMGGREKQGGVLAAANDENSVIFSMDQNDQAEKIKDYIEGIILNRSKGGQTVVQQPSIPARRGEKIARQAAQSFPSSTIRIVSE